MSDVMNERFDAFLDARFAEFIGDFEELAEELCRELWLIAAAQQRLCSDIEDFRRENDTAHREIIAAVKRTE